MKFVLKYTLLVYLVLCTVLAWEAYSIKEMLLLTIGVFALAFTIWFCGIMIHPAVWDENKK